MFIQVRKESGWDQDIKVVEKIVRLEIFRAIEEICWLIGYWVKEELSGF